MQSKRKRLDGGDGGGGEDGSGCGGAAAGNKKAVALSIALRHKNL
jgi:hypothetical protein